MRANAWAAKRATIFGSELPVGSERGRQRENPKKEKKAWRMMARAAGKVGPTKISVFTLRSYSLPSKVGYVVRATAYELGMGTPGTQDRCQALVTREHSRQSCASAQARSLKGEQAYFSVVLKDILSER